MKSLWFMPLTFIAGQHGFALFAPYLGVFLAAATITRGRRKRGPITERLAGLATRGPVVMPVSMPVSVPVATLG